MRQSMEVGNIHHVTIEHTPSGKYFAVLNVEFEPEPRPNQGGTIGIDVGIKTFYSDSNGNTVANPKYLERSMRKLVREDVYKRQVRVCICSFPSFLLWLLLQSCFQ